MALIQRAEILNPHDNVGYLIKRCGIQLSVTIDRGLAEFGMTHAQLSIFLRLFSGSAKTASDLAREQMTDTGSMTRMLDRLEEKNFIARKRHLTDRRIVEVELTDKGRELADQMIDVALHCLNHHLRGFTPEEVEMFKGFLRRVATNNSPEL